MLDTYAYKRSFNILLADFQKLSEYVEPSSSNGNTYSFRIYELILRVCTEFESLCKELLVAEGYSKSPDKMKINDYKTLEDTLKLEGIKVSLTSWDPSNEFIQPFRKWTQARPPLNWYNSYNVVKHNRNREFEEANLNNLRESLCGLFCCLDKAGVPVEGGSTMHWVGDDTVETIYRGVPFALRRTDDEALGSIKRGRGQLTI